jgi:hypothetical protein
MTDVAFEYSMERIEYSRSVALLEIASMKRVWWTHRSIDRMGTGCI